MPSLNPFITIWFIGATISLFIFDKMGRGDDEDAKLIRSEMLVMAIFWPLIWTWVFISLMKDLLTENDETND